MNSTIQQVSGPLHAKPQQKGLPKAAKKFAQQMGLDLSGLEAEADDMWEMLNKMSVEEPAAYENFVDEQMRKQKAQDQEGTNSQQGRMFRPKSGFCIKCMTTGNDGIKVRDLSTKSGKDFYINFVYHEAIEPPKGRSGKAVLDDRGPSADGLELPLLISPCRDIDSTTLAVDVVFHPVVISRCKTYDLFRTQVIDLALSWIGQETGVQYNKKYEMIPWEYHGGRGADKKTPVLFPVDEVLQRQARENSAASDELLKSVMNEKHSDKLISSDAPPIDGNVTSSVGTSSCSKIQEVHHNGSENSEMSSKPKNQKRSAKKKTPAVKRGFLNNSKSALYPSGSSEGHNGGAYSRLMERCQVVDTSALPKVEGSQKTVPSSAPLATNQELPTHHQEQPSHPLSLQEEKEIDDMYSSIDEDFATSLYHEKQSKEPDDLMMKQFADFAKALTGPNGPNRDKENCYDDLRNEVEAHQRNEMEAKSREQVSSNDDFECRIKNKLPTHFGVTAQIIENATSKRELEIVISNVEKCRLKDADLKVSEKTLHVVFPAINLGEVGENGQGGYVQIISPFICNTTTVQAAKSKKNKSIKIRVSES